MTFSLGMAAATSMFALIEGVLLRPLAVADENQLVVGWRQLPGNAGRHWPFHYDDIQALGNTSRALDRIAGVGYNDPSVIALAEPVATTFAQVARVTGDFFEVLGAASRSGSRPSRSPA